MLPLPLCMQFPPGKKPKYRMPMVYHRGNHLQKQNNAYIRPRCMPGIQENIRDLGENKEGSVLYKKWPEVEGQGNKKGAEG